MDLKSIIVATASIALMATPTVAAAQRGAPRIAAAEVSPAGESAGGSELRGGFILPLIGIAAIIAVIIIATRHHHHHNLPTSP